jgi:hypothetical protein
MSGSWNERLPERTFASPDRLTKDTVAALIPGEEAKLKFHLDWEREQRAMRATG